MEGAEGGRPAPSAPRDKSHDGRAFGDKQRTFRYCFCGHIGARAECPGLGRPRPPPPLRAVRTGAFLFPPLSSFLSLVSLFLLPLLVAFSPVCLSVSNALPPFLHFSHPLPLSYALPPPQLSPPPPIASPLFLINAPPPERPQKCRCVDNPQRCITRTSRGPRRRRRREGGRLHKTPLGSYVTLSSGFQ